jgi:outer membrane protein, heavy metal efflux system
MTIAFCVARVAALAATMAAAAPVAANRLTLEAAIAQALAAAPQQVAAAARIDTLRAGRAVADTRPAGSVEVLAENFGVGGRDLNRQIQIGATYNQPIERGGKRAARIGVAEADMAIATSVSLVQRLDIAERVQRLHVEVQAAEVGIGLARAKAVLAEQVANDAARRVQAARDPLFVGSQARTRLAEAQVELELAEHARDAALARLTALWGGSPEGLSIEAPSFLNVHEVAGEAVMAAADQAVLAAQQQRAEANQTLQQANGRTDPVWSLGPRYIGTGDVALVAGINLPFANRTLNRANAERARAEGRQVAAEAAVASFERRQQIMLAVELVNETAHEVDAIRDKVVPLATRTLAEVRAGYDRGGFTFLDVATAATAVHDARLRMLRAATRHHDARATLDRLTGRFAPLVQDAQ